MTVETMPAPESNPAQVRAQVEAELAGVPFRQPIVDDYNLAIHDAQPGEDFWARRDRVLENEAANKARDVKIDHEWLALTESARRAIITSPDVRHRAAAFTVEPLSEALPQKAVSELAESDPRTARLAKLMGKTLGSVLELSPVPDEVLTPDLRHAPSLRRKDDVVDSLTRWKSVLSDFSEHYDDLLQETRNRIEQFPGVTQAERDLVARRYRYARDVKQLGLMAELQEQPVGSTEAKDGIITHELKSGTKLVITSEALEVSPTLLDPQKWESRRQLKDRVYVVTVDGKEYIMKERKTPRHTDVKKNGHKDGLTSKQEFEAAKEFGDLGTIRKGDVELRWEKPLGYVEFPDSYQFCLFESEPDLNTDAPRYKLAHEIMDSSEEYTEEFEQTRERAKQIYDERKDLLRGFDYRDAATKPKRFAISRAARRHKHNYEAQPKPDELTFEEFAQLKANYLIDEARELLSQTMWDHDYTNSDMDGYAFRLHKGKRPTIEIIGFDFEYYRKDPKDAERIKQNVQHSNENGDSANMRAYPVLDTRAIALAASYGMSEQMGYKLSSQEDS